MPKSVGKLFRDVVIDPELKRFVNTILRAPSSDAHSVIEARRRIRAMSSPNTSYLFASEIRGYLEEKTRVGTEQWVFPVAGDLFLDALEANLAGIGPNFFRDHYSGAIGCYRNGESMSATIEASLYCIDLLLHKIVVSFLNKDDQQEHRKSAPLSFVASDDANYGKSIGMFFGLARQSLRDAVDSVVNAGKGEIPTAVVEYVAERREAVEKAMERWEEFHKDPDLAALSDEEYLLKALGVAEQLAYPSLAAAIKEQLGLLHEAASEDGENEDELGKSIHAFYEAGYICLTQGNMERDTEAYHLALRRYGRAVAVFMRIKDRTSAAKALVERARAFIKRGDPPEEAQDSLHEAVCLVVAHMRNLPRGAAPRLDHETAVRFLEKKGYLIEAETYKAAMNEKG